MDSQPNVSIITVNYNGKKFLADLLKSLTALNYPAEKIELIVVDNGSSDHSSNFLKKKYPRVKLIQNKKNEGFAKPNNDGAKSATGEYVAFLNNDMRVDKEWLNQLLTPLQNNSDNNTGCVASKVLNWEGDKIDFYGSSMNIFGNGFQNNYGEDAEKSDSLNDSIFFPNGGAMIMKKDVFFNAGGFDEDYYAYYEDVDLGWRLWILGYKVVLAKNAVVYHRHQGTSSKIFDEDFKKYLLIRNSFYTIAKNYEGINLNRVFSIYLLFFLQKELIALQSKSVDDDLSAVNNSNFNISPFLKAVNEVIDSSDKILKKRMNVQKARKVSDPEIYKLFGNPFTLQMEKLTEWENFLKVFKLGTINDNEILIADAQYLEDNVNEIKTNNLEDVIYFLQDKVKYLESEISSLKKYEKLRYKIQESWLYTFYKMISIKAPASPAPKQAENEKQTKQVDNDDQTIISKIESNTNLLLISPDIIGEMIAGPGIRYWEMSKTLSKFFNVTLLIPGNQKLPEAKFNIRRLNKNNLKESLAACHIVIFQGLLLEKFPEIQHAGKYLIVDIYDPMMLETLENEFFLDKWEQNNHFRYILNGIKKQLLAGDYFICASEKQRDFWLGMLSSEGRINPQNYSLDKSLRKIIGIVPFGLPVEKPVKTKKSLKGVLKGIKEDDFVILWGGGIWNWLDPLTPIKAMKVLSAKNPDIKLFFLGAKHPDARMPEYMHRMYDKAITLADDLKLLNKTVFFNDTWTPYNDRVNFLLEADIGISCHFDFIETEYSFRTRLLDYFWANLPIISSTGDSMSEIVEKEWLGITVDPEDSNSLAEGILKLYEDKWFFKRCVKNLNTLSKQYSWDEVTKPLINYCRNPLFAPDKDKTYRITVMGQLKFKVLKAYKLFCREGFLSLLRRIRSFLLEKIHVILK
tara:strand:- start:2937 stop:5672 length:2736 start_codon:yes stop_codon:yes gene_type:complete